MDDNLLVRGLRTQDSAVVQELVTRYGDRLFRSACLLCGDEAEAQDLVQETFLQAVRSAHRFRGRSSIHTWLHGILLNLTRHYPRHRRRLVYDEELARQEPAARKAGISLQRIEIEDTEYPFLVGVVFKEGDFEKLTAQLRKMPAYEYNGGISNPTHASFNIVPYRVFPSQVSERITHRAGLRNQMFFSKLERSH